MFAFCSSPNLPPFLYRETIVTEQWSASYLSSQFSASKLSQKEQKQIILADACLARSSRQRNASRRFSDARTRTRTPRAKETRATPARPAAASRRAARAIRDKRGGKAIAARQRATQSSSVTAIGLRHSNRYSPNHRRRALCDLRGQFPQSRPPSVKVYSARGRKPVATETCRHASPGVLFIGGCGDVRDN